MARLTDDRGTRLDDDIARWLRDDATEPLEAWALARGAASRRSALVAVGRAQAALVVGVTPVAGAPATGLVAGARPAAAVAVAVAAVARVRADARVTADVDDRSRR